MKKTIVILIIYLFGLTYIYSQKGTKIYGGFIEGLSHKETYKEFKKNKKEYINIDLGNNFIWRLNKNNFIYEGDYLWGVWFTPKGFFASHTYQNCVLFLNYTKEFLENKGYEILYEHTYWNEPLNFSGVYGLLMVDKEKQRVAHLYPFKYDQTTFIPNLKYVSYQKFMEEKNKMNADRKKKQDKTDF